MSVKKTSRRDALRIAGLTLTATGIASIAGAGTMSFADTLPESYNKTLIPGKNYISSLATDSINNRIKTTFKFDNYSPERLYIRSIGRMKDKYRTQYNAIVYMDNNKNASVQLNRAVDDKNVVLGHVKLNYNLPIKKEHSVELSVRGRDKVELKARVLANGVQRKDDDWDIVYIDDSAEKIIDSKIVGNGIYLSSKAKTSLSFNNNNQTDNFDTPSNDAYIPGFGYPIFEDTFDSPVIDTSKWRVYDKDYLSYDWAWIIKENVSVENGNLVLRAKPLETPKVAGKKERTWSSSYMNTLDSCSQEYGRWEVRAKMPVTEGQSAGLHTAAWLRMNKREVPGEIDFAEAFGTLNKLTKTKFNPAEKTLGSVHFSQTVQEASSKWIPANNQRLEDEFHIWAVERTPENVKFYFDNELYHTVNYKGNEEKFNRAFPKGEKMHLRFNFQVGNSYWGLPDENTNKNPEFVIDYVRIWKY